MYWSNLLHIYQPPTQGDDVVIKIAEECYGPLAMGLKNTPKAKFVLNINGVLTETLVRLGYKWIIQEFSEAAKRGQIEFTESAMYHAILPLLPKEEIIRQIKLNHKINKKYFGKHYNPRGFFPPELCYSHRLGDILIELGYEWVVMDEIGYNGKFGNVLYDKIYNLESNSPFAIFFRKRRASDFISMTNLNTPNELVEGLKKIALKDETYVFTAMDGETYGHHHKNLDEIFFEMYNIQKDFEPILLSELIEKVYPREEVNPRACSWATSEQDIKDGTPYALWREVKNEIHNLQWALTDLAIEVIRETKTGKKSKFKKEKWEKSRMLLDKGLHSDQYWWVSGRSSFGEKKAPWLPVMILRGAKFLLEAIEGVTSIESYHQEEAKRIYDIIERKTVEWSDKYGADLNII